MGYFTFIQLQVVQEIMLNLSQTSEVQVNISIFYHREPHMLNSDQKKNRKLITICIETEYTVKHLNYKVTWVFNWTQKKRHLFYQIKGQQSADQETFMHFMCPFPYLHSFLK